MNSTSPLQREQFAEWRAHRFFARGARCPARRNSAAKALKLTSFACVPSSSCIDELSHCFGIMRRRNGESFCRKPSAVANGAQRAPNRARTTSDRVKTCCDRAQMTRDCVRTVCDLPRSRRDRMRTFPIRMRSEAILVRLIRKRARPEAECTRLQCVRITFLDNSDQNWDKNGLRRRDSLEKE